MAPDPADRFASAAQVTVEDLDAPGLDPDALHHVRRVLRLRRGAMVTAADGAGGWRNCQLDDDGGLEPQGPVHREPAPTPALTVAFAPVKGDRPELVVQKLTELGVDRIVPFRSERSVVRWEGERAVRQLERLRRIATAACEQSRRLWVPVVGLGSAPPDGVGSLPELAEVIGALSRGGLADHGGVVAADRCGEPLLRCEPPPSAVLIGPEGGWASGELAGLRTVGLGDTVLRAETAAIAAGTLLTTRRAAQDDA